MLINASARDVVRWCRMLARHSEHPGNTTRLSLSAPMHDVHRDLRSWMKRLGMTTTVDAAGNLRGLRRAGVPDAPCLYMGSHLDTVPDAGAFDGVLGVVWALAVIESLINVELTCDIEVVGFSDEEGIRFGVPFIGSRALAGSVDDDLLDQRDAAGMSVRDALIGFGADSSALPDARARRDAIGYVECHIEQGPVLEHLGQPLGVVAHIAGQSRAEVVFTGSARHAGTTPMDLRHDAAACAAEWMVAVERAALETRDAVATVGHVATEPGVGNVVAGRCVTSLDVRHADDDVRRGLADRIRSDATDIATRRGVRLDWHVRLDQRAVPMDPVLTEMLADAAEECGLRLPVMTSGAGHDAMIVASRMPTAMLFVRSPGGISHHPDESVDDADVAAALAVGRQFILDFAGRQGA